MDLQLRAKTAAAGGAAAGSSPAISSIDANQGKPLPPAVQVGQARGTGADTQAAARPIVDRIEVERPVGLGGFARVWLGSLDGKKVVFKVLLEQHANGPCSAARAAPAR